MKILIFIVAVVLVAAVWFYAGYEIGKHSPCSEVEQTQSWKVPSEDAQ